jgi:hypothetical protein
MSSFLPIGSPADIGAFETGIEVLSSMSENGNLAASEFYHNLKHVKKCLDRYRAERQPDDIRRRPSSVATAAIDVAFTSASVEPSATTTAQADSTSGAILAPEQDFMNPGYRYAQPGPSSSSGQALGQEDHLTARELPGGFTTAMAFMEPTMQDFLAQSDLDLGLLHPVEAFMNEAENLYSGHEFS